MKGFSKIIIAFLLMIVALFFLTKQCGQPKQDQLQEAESYQQDTSTLILPLNLDIASFEQSFNSQMDEMGWFYEEEGLEVNRNLSIAYRVKKDGRAQLYPQEGSIQIEIPLLIDIRPQLSSSLSFGLGRDMRLQSKVNLQSKVDVDIDETWELLADANTSFTIVESPELNIAGIRINFGEQLENNLKLSAAEINEQVEQQIKAAIPTKEIVQAIWNELKTPYKIDGEEFTAWATVEPLQVAASDLIAHQPGVMQTVFEIPAIISVKTGEKPNFTGNQQLPKANRVNEVSASNSLFLFPLKVPFSTFTSYVNQLDNLSFSIQNREVQLSNFDAKNQKGNLVVTAKFTTGDTEGNVELVGQPVFNKEKQQIQVDLQSIQSNSNNKAIDNLVNAIQKNKSVRNSIENKMVYDLQDDLANLNFTITQQLKATKFNEYASLNGYLDHITIRNIYVGDNHLVLATEIEAQTVCSVGAKQ